MNTIFIQYHKTIFGELLIGSYNEELCICDWRYRKMRVAIDKRIQSGLRGIYEEKESEVIKQTIQQLSEYESGERTQFDIPLNLVGTDFQKSVWRALMEIPYGKTETYFGLSKKLKNEKAIRAVAAANGANAISIIVPCHRVIGSNGELVGYAGGLSAKKRLLKLENHAQDSEQLSLFDDIF